MPDPNGYLLPEEQQVLLRRYAPVLVLWPEMFEQPPYPDDGDPIYTLRGSYHPRRPEFFLKRARIRYHPKVLFTQPRLLWDPEPLTHELQRAQQAVTEARIDEAMTDSRPDPRFAGLGEKELRAAARTELVQSELAERVKGFDLPGFRGDNRGQWRAYFKALDEATPEEKRAVIYGRVVQGLAPLGKHRAPPDSTTAQTARFAPYDVSLTRVALQYWFHYVYDDWANRHEGDWESITLLVELSPDIITRQCLLNERELLAGTSARDMGYASHEDGHRRRWVDVQKTTEGRPIVYVARGSQASYFAWRIDGYPTSARVGFVERLLAAIGSLLRGHRIFGRRWDAEFRARFTGRDPKNTDWTPADPLADDRLDFSSAEPLERLIPTNCRGERRAPSFEPDAGLDDATYQLITDDLFWIELVQEHGVRWGENSLLPGTKGPKGQSKAARERKRQTVNQYARLEERVLAALDQLMEPRPRLSQVMPELDTVLQPLRPSALRQDACFPGNIRVYIFEMWAAILRTHPEAWPGGPGLYLRWVFRRHSRHNAQLDRNEPDFHLKALLAHVRRARYEIQHAGSKWDNPFAWVHYVCQADTFFYAVSRSSLPETLDTTRLDCPDP